MAKPTNHKKSHDIVQLITIHSIDFLRIFREFKSEQ